MTASVSRPNSDCELGLRKGLLLIASDNLTSLIRDNYIKVEYADAEEADKAIMSIQRDLEKLCTGANRSALVAKVTAIPKLMQCVDDDLLSSLRIAWATQDLRDVAQASRATWGDFVHLNDLSNIRARLRRPVGHSDDEARKSLMETYEGRRRTSRYRVWGKGGTVSFGDVSEQ